MATYSLAWPHTHWHGHILTGMATYSLAWPHTHWHGHILTGMATYSLAWPHTHWHGHILTGMDTHSLAWTHTHSQTHTHTLTHIDTHSHTHMTMQRMIIHTGFSLKTFHSSGAERSLCTIESHDTTWTYFPSHPSLSWGGN